MALRRHQGLRHPLDPLLAPRSLALVGASTKPDSPGNSMVKMPLLAGYEGRIYPVNPGYDAVEGVRCFPSLAAIPETVDHVVLGVANKLGNKLWAFDRNEVESRFCSKCLC